MDALKPTLGANAVDASSCKRIPADADEAIVRLDFVGDYAEVWTQRRGLLAHLRRLGFVETDRHGRGVWLRGQVRQISFRKTVPVQRIPTTPSRVAALAKARETRRLRREAMAGRPCGHANDGLEEARLSEATAKEGAGFFAAK